MPHHLCCYPMAFVLYSCKMCMDPKVSMRPRTPPLTQPLFLHCGLSGGRKRAHSPLVLDPSRPTQAPALRRSLNGTSGLPGAQQHQPLQQQQQQQQAAQEPALRRSQAGNQGGGTGQGQEQQGSLRRSFNGMQLLALPPALQPAQPQQPGEPGPGRRSLPGNLGLGTGAARRSSLDLQQQQQQLQQQRQDGLQAAWAAAAGAAPAAAQAGATGAAGMGAPQPGGLLRGLSGMGRLSIVHEVDEEARPSPTHSSGPPPAMWGQEGLQVTHHHPHPLHLHQPHIHSHLQLGTAAGGLGAARRRAFSAGQLHFPELPALLEEDMGGSGVAWPGGDAGVGAAAAPGAPGAAHGSAAAAAAGAAAWHASRERGDMITGLKQRLLTHIYLAHVKAARAAAAAAAASSSSSAGQGESWEAFAAGGSLSHAAAAHHAQRKNSGGSIRRHSAGTGAGSGGVAGGGGGGGSSGSGGSVQASRSLRLQMKARELHKFYANFARLRSLVVWKVGSSCSRRIVTRKLHDQVPAMRSNCHDPGSSACLWLFW